MFVENTATEMSIPVIRIYFRLGKGKSCVTATWFSLQSYLALCCGSYVHFFPLSLSPYPFMPCFAMVYMGDGGYQVPINFLFFLSSLFSTFLLSSFTVYLFFPLFSLPLSPLPPPPPQQGAADAEIEVRSLENTELEGSPFKAWGRSVYSHTCYAYCLEFLPRLFLPFRSIRLHFFRNLSPEFFPC